MTDIVLNQHVPGGVMKQLADACGGITYDQYAPGGCIGQLYAASGETDPLDQYYPGGVMGQIEEEIEGGAGLDWVPENALIHIDLVRAFNAQDAAWVDGTGVVAVDTLLGADPNTENYWGPTAYDPDLLVSDGYTSPEGASADVALIGVARTQILAGATVAFKLKMLEEGATDTTMIFMSATGDYAVEFGASNLQVNAFSNDVLDIQINDIVNLGVGAKNGYASTINHPRFELAANGSAVESATLTEGDYPTSGDPIVAVMLSITSGAAEALQSITLYAALPDTDGLSELSEV